MEGIEIIPHIDKSNSYQVFKINLYILYMSYVLFLIYLPIDLNLIIEAALIA